MRTTSTLATLWLMVSLVTAAPAPVYKPKKEPGKTDLEKMQGTWVRVSLAIDGRPGVHAPCTITIKGTTMAFGSPGDDWNLTLDPSKSPKHIHSSRLEKKASIADFWGIYSLEGDTLTICCREGSNEADRPLTFDKTQRGVWLQVLKRQAGK
jgi:uncharacterized protein (TIGR03067 family)